MQEHDLGIVSPRIERFEEPLHFTGGGSLPTYELVYETYGELNSSASNALLICHALSGHHHAAGYHSETDRKPGWWNACIGPGKPIDTRRFFVVSLNNLGGCHGSTGPASENPQTGEVFGPEFPQPQVDDWVDAQARLADRLGIHCWAAVVGGSLGGMQAMAWSLRYPERLRHCVVIAAAMKLSAQNIAFNEIARRAIMSDPGYAGGYYLREGKQPTQGLALARMVGHITYLSDDAMASRFGRELQPGSEDDTADGAPQFQIESYLRYQGQQFSSVFDANSYVLMTRALDLFDLAAAYGGDAVAAFAKASCDYLVLSFSTDWRFSPARSREIVDALLAAERPVSYAEIKADEGHDAFLLPIPRYLAVLDAYLKRVEV
ncbi:homoserine O-succinyltransferase MetX [Congregibacter litoralis]|uniref:Homoserine O-succinyltransferase n=1 Tax=Congregibacter litoralis KT71 TaxID=314285 RepID=A4A9D3_9GAMM|nr:homoserine O-acetyltransferase [Congregibacter litoralis]EAQ97675.1 homoserine O-acetyltransferase [Congregibacter litoralis KT71]